MTIITFTEHVTCTEQGAYKYVILLKVVMAQRTGAQRSYLS